MTSIRTTDTHVYFWGSYLSNFAKAPFKQSLWRGGPLLTFHHSEGYYMACKALVFGATYGHVKDGEWVPSLLEQIMAEKNPKAAKGLARTIPDFREKIWTPMSKNIMFRGIWAKFSQNINLARDLLQTGDRILVEGSPHDQIWGVGLAWDDPRIENTFYWQGTNWLGEILMVVRALLREMDQDEIEMLDPYMVEFT